MKFTHMKFGWILLFSTPLTVIGILLGDFFVWCGPLTIMTVMLLGDQIWNADNSLASPKTHWLNNFFLFCQLPVSLLALTLLAWSVAPGDLWGIGALIQTHVDLPILERHARLSLFNKTGAALATGFLLSTNSVVAHELTHRTSSFLSMLVGRWLLAMVGDTQFSISHVYGHHLWVGTDQDSATARRGESLYRFFVRSSIGQLRSAFEIERSRLKGSGKSGWTLKNRFITGQLMTLSIMALFVLAAGSAGFGFFVVCALYSKFLYETVNYIQHYGLVRVKNTPVEPRHSWDCVTKLSGVILFNLTRHSDHHARGEIPFWQLRPESTALKLEHGYMSAILLAMMPPLWNRHMTPLLTYWDQNLATKAEIALLREQQNTRVKAAGLTESASNQFATSEFSNKSDS